MEKCDPLPTVRYDVQGETFAKAIEKCPTHCYVKRNVPEETLKELQMAEASAQSGLEDRRARYTVPFPCTSASRVAFTARKG